MPERVTSEEQSRAGRPLVATAARWTSATAVCVLLSVALVQAFRGLWHSPRTLGSFAWTLVAVDALIAGLLWASFRAEERRLSRELRTARAGTAALRAMVIGRRARRSLWSRVTSTGLGTAAVFLADGDRPGAVAACAAESLFARGGRRERLRAVVQADLDRASGTPAGRARAIERLLEGAPIGNREADLYRVHVLVKSVLEHGDAQAGSQVADQLQRADDEELRAYRIWLGAWFEWDGFDGGAQQSPGGAVAASASEGELRVAALLARAHGADKLVERLDARLARLASIAPEPKRK